MTRATAPDAAGRSGRAGAGSTERVGWLTSVRGRLLLIALLPMVGLLILTGVQARSSASVVADARRALTLAVTSTATMELLHQLGREQAEAVALRERGGQAGELLVTAQRARTDGAHAAFRSAASAAAAAAPGLSPALDAATTELAKLATVRTGASSAPGAGASVTTSVQALYSPMAAALLGVADAVPAQLVDRALANRTRAIAALAAAKHALAQQRDLLRTAFSRRAFAAGDSATLVRLATIEQERMAAFERVAGPEAQAGFDRLVAGPDVQTMTRLRDAALAGAAGSLAVDSDAWYVAATHTIRWMHEVELTLAADLSRVAGRARDDATRDAVVAVAGAAGLVVVGVAIAAALATRTSRRLGRLRRAAMLTARRLPIVVDEITAAPDPVRTHDEYLVAAARVGGEFSSERRDEIGHVGAAFGVVHATALRLAADQALLRLDIEALVVALARRSQKLVQRQLGAIDGLESAETDPDTLSTYYFIDHLAARMRRNAENLLVLAGAEPGRRFAGTFPLLDVVRAASAEIADYPRVDAAGLPAAAVAGHAVGDVVHLLAELLENAANFSAPHTRVSVTARHSLGGLLIAVYDDGIGMTAEALSAVNVRLAGPTMLTSALAGTLGLLVVARLAARHGISVELRSRDGNGTVALIILPAEILAEPVATDVAPLTTSAWRWTAEAPRPAPPRVAAQRVPAQRVPTHPAPTRSIPAQQAPARLAVRQASPIIYDQLRSAWFSNRTTPSPDDPTSDDYWNSPGDAERAQVGRVLAQAPAQTTDAGLPRRRNGAQLLAGSIPDAGRFEPRSVADPEWIRSQLTGLSQGLAAASRTPTPTQHIGRTR